MLRHLCGLSLAVPASAVEADRQFSSLSSGQYGLVTAADSGRLAWACEANPQDMQQDTYADNKCSTSGKCHAHTPFGERTRGRAKNPSSSLPLISQPHSFSVLIQYLSLQNTFTSMAAKAETGGAVHKRPFIWRGKKRYLASPANSIRRYSLEIRC